MTVLLRDMVMYSAGALFAETKRWLDGGAGAGDVPSGAFGQGDTAFVTSLTLKPQVLKQGTMTSNFFENIVSTTARSLPCHLVWYYVVCIAFLGKGESFFRLKLRACAVLWPNWDCSDYAIELSNNGPVQSTAMLKNDAKTLPLAAGTPPIYTCWVLPHTCMLAATFDITVGLLESSTEVLKPG